MLDWRWNMRAILTGYRYFEQKWGVDVTEPGRFNGYLLDLNGQLGLLPRLFPSTAALRIDHALGRVWRLARMGLALLWAPRWALTSLRAWWIGYYDWPRSRAA